MKQHEGLNTSYTAQEGLMTKRIKNHFHCIIELNDDDDIQWEHLPEELQSYFDSYSDSISVTKDWGYTPQS